MAYNKQMENKANIKVISGGKEKWRLPAVAIKMLRVTFALAFALCWGALAMLCLNDYDKPGVCLPQHTWFLLGSILTCVIIVGLVLKRTIFGAVLGALIGIIFPIAFLHQYNVGYSYWEKRPESERQQQEIAGPTLSGDAFDIKNCKAKLLLVDYWATWCGPCVASLPHIREVWDKYHSQGLDIVGVSLDEKRDHLADFVQKHELPYPQIFFGEDGKSRFDNPLALRYGVAAIPQLVLIEPKSQMVLTPVQNGRELKWTVQAALNALNKSGAAGPDVTNNRLATFAPLPYVTGLLGGILGALFELIIWRRLAGYPRPQLKRVK